jgi:hypothetical protein
MSRTLLETIVLTEDTLVFFRCDGTKVELCIASEGYCLVKEIDAKGMMHLLLDLNKFLATMLEKEGKI